MGRKHQALHALTATHTTLISIRTPCAKTRVRRGRSDRAIPTGSPLTLMLLTSASLYCGVSEEQF